jgi:Cu-processing system permease protein
VSGASSVYQSRRFVELMLAQPVPRGTLFRALYTGLALPLAAAWLLGCLPWLLATGTLAPATLALFLGAGTVLCLCFSALAFVIALSVDNRLRGLGLALGLWLVLALAWDALVLFVAYAFADWPLEGVILALCAANPVDLARILVLLQFDLGALMGYTGAVFKLFFQSGLGSLLAGTVLLLWVLLPVLVGQRLFRGKDF